jgi:phosphoglycerate dehydrogenase-like enzyme
VAIAVPLQADRVEAIQASAPAVEVLYEPELLPPMCYVNDHRGPSDFRRPAAAQARWRAMLESAEILFGIPGDTPEGLADAVRTLPRLQWVQATAAGAGEQVRAAGLSATELERVVVTSASGVHASPLAEFALFGLLAFAKNLPRLLDDQRHRRWEHYPTGELAGRTLLVVGLGRIGAEVARRARAFGMEVVGVNRSGRSDCAEVPIVYGTDALPDLVGTADALVLSLPLTDATRGLVDAALIARIKPGATLVNVGRGGVVDEAAMIDALRSGGLAGAALDVVTVEPLAPDSPLWDMPNVLLSPHTAALSERENERIVDVLIENLHRFLDDRPLVNVVDVEHFY